MTLTFVVPSALTDLTGGRGALELEGEMATVGDALRVLRSRQPSVYDRLADERGEIRPHVNVFVDGADIRWSGALGTALRDGAEIVVLPAVSGG